MEEILFDGVYKKLHRQTSAVLKDVRILKIDDNTPKELIMYDTAKESGCRYDLKNGTYLQLFFVGEFGIPFSTFRKLNKENFRYYDLCGKEFKITIGRG